MVILSFKRLFEFLILFQTRADHCPNGAHINGEVTLDEFEKKYRPPYEQSCFGQKND